MKFIVKIFAVALLLNLMPMTDCAAKILRDDSRKFSFETSDKWQIVFVNKKDSQSIDWIRIKLDEDTEVQLTQNLNKLNYKNLNSMTEAEKTQLKDVMIQTHVDNAKTSDYKLTMDKAEVLSEGIFLGMTMEKDGKKYKVGEIYLIKDYNVYIIFASGTPQTIVESVKTALTLKVNGIDFSTWANS